MTDYKQLCTELLQAWDDAPTPSDFVDTIGYGFFQKIRVALAQPAPKAQVENHPITPPPELVLQWYAEGDHQLGPYYGYIATQAARWGADMELEACCEWQDTFNYPNASNLLRAARRPKPPSLKEQALTELNLTADPEGAELSRTQVELIRRALESLPD